MNKLHKARWMNILRKAAKVNRLLKNGYIVFDQRGERSSEFKFCKKEKYLYQGGDDLGNGALSAIWIYAGQDTKYHISELTVSIKQHNAENFDKYTAMHPKNFTKI